MGRSRNLANIIDKFKCGNVDESSDPIDVKDDDLQVQPSPTNARESGGAHAKLSSRKDKAKRKQYSVWDHFDRVVDEETKNRKAQCEYCPTTLAIVQGSTSSLTHHAKKCAPISGIRDPKHTRLSTGSTICGTLIFFYPISSGHETFYL